MLQSHARQIFFVGITATGEIFPGEGLPVSYVIPIGRG